MWKIVFVSIFFLLFSNSKSTQEIQKILRLQLEENGYKTVTMSDGELVVNYLLNAQGGIEDCKSLRRRRMLLGMLKYDVSEKFLDSLFALFYSLFPLQHDHIGDEDGKVIYLDQDIDVQWYARQCTRFLRKIQVPGNLGFENTVQGVCQQV